MNRRQRTFMIVVSLVIGLGVASALVLKAFNESLLYFISPTDVAEGKAPAEKAFRLGGMVADDSVRREEDSLMVRFDITDFAHTVTVEYEGILPDLFREGQGVITNGRMGDNGVFVAAEVLAKHDENYMPPEVAEALEAGQARSEKGATE